MLALIFILINIFTLNVAEAKTFKNCTELNKVYKGGVALPGATNTGGATRYQPKFNKALFRRFSNPKDCNWKAIYDNYQSRTYSILYCLYISGADNYY